MSRFRRSAEWLTLSYAMRKRIARGEADEQQVMHQTKRMFDALEVVLDHLSYSRIAEFEHCSRELTKTLKEHEAHIDINATLQLEGHVAETLLEKAAYLDNHEINQSAEVKSWGHVLIKALLEAGADPFYSPQERDSATAIALADLRREVMQALFENGVRLRQDGARPGIDWHSEWEAQSTLTGTANDAEKERLDQFQQFLNSYYDRAEALQKQLDEGEITHASLKRDDICLLSLIQRHHAVFAPAIWRGKEQEALALILSLPPFLQQELAPQWTCLSLPHAQIEAAQWEYRIAQPERGKA